jgi:hypothetical protein
VKIQIEFHINMPSNPKLELKTELSSQIIRTSATVSFTDTKSTVISSTFSSTHKLPETSTSKSQNGSDVSKTSTTVEYHLQTEKKSHETLRVCRDFIRGLCRRAKSCRVSLPPPKTIENTLYDIFHIF